MQNLVSVSHVLLICLFGLSADWKLPLQWFESKMRDESRGIWNNAQDNQTSRPAFIFYFCFWETRLNKEKQQSAFPFLKRKERDVCFLCGREDMRIQMCSLLTGAYSFPSLPPPPSSVFSDTHKHRHTPQSPRAGRGSEARLFQVGSVFLRLGSKMRGSADGLSTVWLQRACLFKSCLRLHTQSDCKLEKQQQ